MVLLMVQRKILVPPLLFKVENVELLLELLLMTIRPLFCTNDQEPVSPEPGRLAASVPLPGHMVWSGPANAFDVLRTVMVIWSLALEPSAQRERRLKTYTPGVTPRMLVLKENGLEMIAEGPETCDQRVEPLRSPALKPLSLILS